MALAAVLLGTYAKCFFAVMASTAGLAALHISHGEGAFFGEVEDCTVAGFAILVFCEVLVVAEDNRWNRF